MAREVFEIEKGLSITAANEDSGAYIITGTAAPGADGAEQDDAPIGSLYLRRNGASSTMYQKITDTNLAADWQENGSSSAVIGVWRPETVSVVTNDTQGAGVRDVVANPFSDDEAPVLLPADFVVGEYIISDADGSPALLEITAVAAPNVTFAVAGTPLAANDTYIARHYLPDSPGGQEGQAIVNYNGSIMIKIGDVDWNFATGISLSSGYTPGSGDVTSADSVESALEKVDGNVDALEDAVGVAQGATDMGTYTGALLNDNESAKENIQQLETEAEASRTTSGTAAGATDMGTYTGSTLTDNQSTKVNIQELETALEAIAAPTTGTVTAITALQDIDTILVDNNDHAEWECVAFEEATPANKKFFKVSALHNGTAAADATSVTDSVHTKLKIGNFNLVTSVDLNGAGAAQEMRLRASSSTAGVTVRFRRTSVL